MSIPITLPVRPDDNGFIDRECPNSKCQYVFKVLMKDWDEKVADGIVHCPLCGHVDASDKWWTQDQRGKMQKVAKGVVLNQLQRELDGIFGKLAHSTQNTPFLHITYKPERRFLLFDTYIGQKEKIETDICCEKCETHYRVRGAAFFCPCCGHNSAVQSFNDVLDSIKNTLELLRDIKLTAAEKNNIDIAESICRKILENTIGNLVAAFQEFAACKYAELTGKKIRVNDFQIIDKGSQLFEKATEKKYGEWLSPSELNFMNVMFQRRHLLEHKNGMVDEMYLKNSHDTSYSIGQRIVVKKPDAYALLDIVRKLGNGLMEIQAGGKAHGND